MFTVSLALLLAPSHILLIFCLHASSTLSLLQFHKGPFYLCSDIFDFEAGLTRLLCFVRRIIPNFDINMCLLSTLLCVFQNVDV